MDLATDRLGEWEHIDNNLLTSPAPAVTYISMPDATKLNPRPSRLSLLIHLCFDDHIPYRFEVISA